MEERQEQLPDKDMKKAARPSGDRSVFAQYFGERKYSIAYPPQNVKGQCKKPDLFCSGQSSRRFEAMTNSGGLADHWLCILPVALASACFTNVSRMLIEGLVLLSLRLGSVFIPIWLWLARNKP